MLYLNLYKNVQKNIIYFALYRDPLRKKCWKKFCPKRYFDNFYLNTIKSIFLKKHTKKINTFLNKKKIVICTEQKSRKIKLNLQKKVRLVYAVGWNVINKYTHNVIKKVVFLREGILGFPFSPECQQSRVLCLKFEIYFWYTIELLV